MRALDVLVSTREQIDALLVHPARPARVYLETGCAFTPDGALVRPRALSGISSFVALPMITRQEPGSPDMEDLRTVLSEADRAGFDGVLVRNLEQLAFFLEEGYGGVIVADAPLYVWNHLSAGMLLFGIPGAKGCAEITMPHELSLKQFAAAIDAYRGALSASVVVYGHTPMMVSAGCLKQTLDGCAGTRYRRVAHAYPVTDRTGRTLPVTCDCRYCYNIIYNAHPLSLHDALERILKIADGVRLRLDFTAEDAARCGEVLTFFAAYPERGGKAKPPYADYTLGRSVKGVE